MNLGMTEILKIRKSFWLQLGDKIKQWIWADSDAGILQNGTFHYVSEQYKKYKANYMKRFTTGEGQLYSKKVGESNGTSFYSTGRTYFNNPKAFKTSRGLSNSFTKNRKSTGKNLASVKGQSVVSNRTSSVDMKLTGKTMKGLHAESATDSGVMMAYRPQDADKIIGNEEKYNRVIAGLSEKNIQKALEEYSSAIDENLLAWSKKEIKIYVGRK